MQVTRRQAREWAVQMLTAAELDPTKPAAEIVSDFWEQLKTLEDDDGGTGGRIPRGKIKAFSDDSVMGVLAERETLDGTIGSLMTDGWTVDRLGTIERVVLRLALWELLHTETAAAVIINEAVDLVNWFSIPKSRFLVNGILSQYVKNTGR